MGGRCARCEGENTAQDDVDGNAPTIQSLTDEQVQFKEVPAITADLLDIREGNAITWCNKCSGEGTVTAEKAICESDACDPPTFKHHDSVVSTIEATKSGRMSKRSGGSRRSKESSIGSKRSKESSGSKRSKDSSGSILGSKRSKESIESKRSKESGQRKRSKESSERDCSDLGSDVDSDSGDSDSDSRSVRSTSSCGSAISKVSFVDLALSAMRGKRRKDSDRTRNKKTHSFIEKRLGKFRESMLAAPGPGDKERDRGVYIEELFDFYDPVSCKVRKRKMGDNVVHRRKRKSGGKKNAGKRSSTLSSLGSTAQSERSDSSSEDALESECPSQTSEAQKSFGSHSSCSNSDGSRGSRVLAGFTQILVRTTKKRKSNLELVANWGAVVGKVLHTLVIDFSAMMDKAIREKRYLAASQTVQSGAGKMRCALRERAGLVANQAMKLAKQLKTEPKDQLDKEWRDRSLLPYLFSTEYIDTLLLLARGAAKLIAKQPTVATALAPCHVFGDIHGQLRDLLLLFACFGSPHPQGKISFVFNGDFVDRGSHQVEVIGLLMALKLWMPDQVVLVRGNHEDRTMNERYGFKDACVKGLGSSFGNTLFERVHQTFDELPLACLVEQKVLCVHGGLGDGAWTLDQLRTVKRPIKDLLSSTRRWIADILWSDPIEDGKSGDPQVFGVHESPRGKVGTRFAWDVTKTFCARNGVSLIVRSHQSKEGSPGFDVMHEHMLVRVFSARDYENHGNDGAILTITKASDTSDLLKISPKVLRSVTKARDEANRHKKEQLAIEKLASETADAQVDGHGSSTTEVATTKTRKPPSSAKQKSKKQANSQPPSRMRADVPNVGLDSYRRASTDELLAIAT